MTVSHSVRARLFAEFTSCPGCGRTREQLHGPHQIFLTVEHLIPRSHGGTSQQSNLLAICAKCNSTRRDQSPWDWYGEQHLIYADGWPLGSRSKEAKRQRQYARAVAALLCGVDQTPYANAVAALLGWGPVPTGQHATPRGTRGDS